MSSFGGDRADARDGYRRTVDAVTQRNPGAMASRDQAACSSTDEATTTLTPTDGARCATQVGPTRRYPCPFPVVPARVPVRVPEPSPRSARRHVSSVGGEVSLALVGCRQSSPHMSPALRAARCVAAPQGTHQYDCRRIALRALRIPHRHMPRTSETGSMRLRSGGAAGARWCRGHLPMTMRSASATAAWPPRDPCGSMTAPVQ